MFGPASVAYPYLCADLGAGTERVVYLFRVPGAVPTDPERRQAIAFPHAR